MASVKYYASSVPQGKLDNSDVEELKTDNQAHPLFKFDDDFFTKLQSITTDTLGLAQPYISLRVVDDTGEPLADLNVNFFFQGRNEKLLGQNIRHSDRPAMSLKEVVVKTTNASGYLYYTDVNITLNIHAPHFLSDALIAALIVPGVPLDLEYGWSTPGKDPKHPLTNVREVLKFQVVTYDLNVDETNQMQLVIRGKAFNDLFNNLYVGDTGQDEEGNVAKENASNIIRKELQMKTSVDYLKEVQKGPMKHDFSLVRLMAESYENTERRTRDVASKKFKENFVKLQELDKKVKEDTIALHDVIWTMCHETFQEFASRIVVGEEFRIVYGDTNAGAGNFAGKSLAEFPVNIKDLIARIKKMPQEGQTVPTLKSFLEMILRDFVENETIWKEGLSGADLKSYSEPEVIMNFTNNGSIYELQILDATAGLPDTTSNLPEKAASETEARNQVIDSSERDLLVLEIGHAQSFVKKMSLSQITDQAMKAALIARMHEDRTEKEKARGSQTGKDTVLKAATSPIALPLQGSLEVLGHTDWKPFKAFYLSTGLYLVDGVYKIMEVTHRLSADGFTTSLVIMYN